MLIEVYLGNLGDDKDKPQAMSKLSKTPVNARNVDEKAIAALAKERELLKVVTEFFVDTVKHYQVAADAADDSIVSRTLTNILNLVIDKAF
jgi:hypothetical protein